MRPRRQGSSCPHHGLPAGVGRPHVLAPPKAPPRQAGPQEEEKMQGTGGPCYGLFRTARGSPGIGYPKTADYVLGVTCFATSSPLSTRPGGTQSLLEESEALQGPNPERAHFQRVLCQRAGGHCSHTPDFELNKTGLWLSNVELALRPCPGGHRRSTKLLIRKI